MPMPPPPDLASLSMADIARLVEQRVLPPVDRWDPPHCGDSEMRIASDGTWFHQGRAIHRTEMVRLFSTLLRLEADGRHVLVTPVEKLDIAVDDAPFVAIEMASEGTGAERRIAFRLNTGDLVPLDADHPLIVTETVDGPRPYLSVRGGMRALIVRPVYYELAMLATEDAAEPAGVWSHGELFPMLPR